MPSDTWNCPSVASFRGGGGRGGGGCPSEDLRTTNGLFRDASKSEKIVFLRTDASENWPSAGLPPTAFFLRLSALVVAVVVTVVVVAVVVAVVVIVAVDVEKESFLSKL